MSGIPGYSRAAGGPHPTQDRRRGLCGVFDGELYNHRRLNDELAGLGFGARTRSEAETVLNAYAAWGEDCVHRLNGMFAFVIHDQRQRRLFGARDHFGHKPLYYVCDRNGFAFAGDPEALLQHSSAHREPDPEALARYLVFGCVPAPMTIYRGMRKLPRAHRFRFDLDTGRFAVEPYWELPAPVLTGRNEAHWTGRVSAALDAAVDRRLDTDEPFGVLLAGGADGTRVADSAARRVGGATVLTFSLGHSVIAKPPGTVHHEHAVESADLLEALAEMEAHLDEPLADAAILPTWMLARFAARTVTVALWGAGGAELGAGAGPVRAPFFHRRRRLRRWIGALTPDQLTGLLTPEVLRRINPDALFSQLRWLDRSMVQRDPAVRDAHLLVRTSLADGLLAAMNRASTACSLRIRSPLLDVEFVELVAPRFRQATQGSAAPMGAWLRNELRDPLLAALDDRIIREQGLFRPEAVRRLLDDHLSGRRDHRRPLFALFMFQRWHRRWMERAEVTPVSPVTAIAA